MSDGINSSFHPCNIPAGSFDFVAIGNVKRGEWMRRCDAEAKDLEYREITEAEAAEIERQQSTDGY